MSATYECLLSMLDDRGASYDILDHATLSLHFAGQVAVYRIVVLVDEENELLSVFGHWDHFIPPGCVPDILDATSRANAGMMFGKFEVHRHPDSTVIRFSCAQIIPEIHGVDQSIIDRMLGVTMKMLDVYVPAFLSVIYGNELPADAVCRVEGPYQDGDGDDDNCQDDDTENSTPTE